MARLTDGIPGLSEHAVRLDGPEFDGGIIGTYENEDGETCLVYGYDRLTDALAEAWGMPREEVQEVIEYDTLRSLPYMGKCRPVIVREVCNV